ncbi:hypothetical protein BD289DRAFT_478553 [Coniella lustricola]|uniref:Ricin B lectin domain-containing protein n=1 Tax=Coniella lustricola TaxID=2025994 RepID=A0A2T3ALV5_9PEZI|nr:hypothetical protein BD289DRAFT_478553 [Coniella lustricola]
MHTTRAAVAAFVAASGVVAVPTAPEVSFGPRHNATVINRCPDTVLLNEVDTTFDHTSNRFLKQGAVHTRSLHESGFAWRMYNQSAGTVQCVNFDMEKYNNTSPNVGPSRFAEHVLMLYTTNGTPFGSHTVTLDSTANRSCDGLISDKERKGNVVDRTCVATGSMVITLCDDIPEPVNAPLSSQSPTPLPGHRKHKPWAGTRHRSPNMPPYMSLQRRVEAQREPAPAVLAAVPSSTVSTDEKADDVAPIPDARPSKVPWPMPWNPFAPGVNPSANPQRRAAAGFHHVETREDSVNPNVIPRQCGRYGGEEDDSSAPKPCTIAEGPYPTASSKTSASVFTPSTTLPSMSLTSDVTIFDPITTPWSKPSSDLASSTKDVATFSSMKSLMHPFLSGLHTHRSFQTVRPTMTKLISSKTPSQPLNIRTPFPHLRRPTRTRNLLPLPPTGRPSPVPAFGHLGYDPIQHAELETRSEPTPPAKKEAHHAEPRKPTPAELDQAEPGSLDGKHARGLQIEQRDVVHDSLGTRGTSPGTINDDPVESDMPPNRPVIVHPAPASSTSASAKTTVTVTAEVMATVTSTGAVISAPQAPISSLPPTGWLEPGWTNRPTNTPHTRPSLVPCLHGLLL